MKNKKSSTVSYKQSLQNQEGVNYTDRWFVVVIVVVAPNLQMVVIIKKRENINHAGFDDVKKDLLDNECYHQKGGECESCMF